jgi:hypothetical protein
MGHARRAVADQSDDVASAALAYDAALREQIRPWYRAGVEQDAEARCVAAALLAAWTPTPTRVTRAR